VAFKTFAEVSTRYQAAGMACITWAALGVKMAVGIISRKINACRVTIKLVDGSLVKGKINLHRSDVDIQRVSDLFTKVADPFIVVFDANAEDKTGRILILNKRHIVWIAPEEEPPKEDKPPQLEDEKPKEPSGGSLLDRLRST
jgi:hypothetical protein